MNLNEEQTAELKTWVIKKLENISDADSDVLADLVLALVLPSPDSSVSIQSEEQTKKITIENLQDFLGDNTEIFVNEIFNTFGSKPQSQQASSEKPAVPPLPLSSVPNGDANNVMASTIGIGRKRSYNDRDEGGGYQDSHYNRGERSNKQMRKGRGGRGDFFGSRGGRQFGAMPDASSYSNTQHNSFHPGMHQPRSGLPFDPNDPVAAVLAMQAMGFPPPPLPGMSPYPQSNASPNFPPSGANMPGARPKQRCHDYDTMGFCARIPLCPYEHAPDEYDPATANLVMDVRKSSNSADGSSNREPRDGNERGRGRGRGRGDHGGGLNRRTRADFSQTGPNHDQSITTVVVEQIPEDKFDEQHVREFFAEFGNITEVSMQPYKRLALVRFEDYVAAKRAYNSPKAIFDNRFVKVYWYKPDGQSSNTNGARKSGSPSTTTDKKDQMPFDKEEFEKQQAEAQRIHEEKMKKKKANEEAKAALEKKRNELLKKQQEEKAKLMEKLAERNGGTASLDVGMSESDNANDTNNSKPTAQTQALRAQLAALEAEAKSLGIDPNAPVETFSSRGRGRGRGLYRSRANFLPRGRGGFRGRTAPIGMGVRRLDNRPKSVAINGVEFDTAKEVALKEFIVAIDEFATIEPNPERPDSRIVAFKDRWTAEKLIDEIMKEKLNIPNIGEIKYTWVSKPLPSISAPLNEEDKEGDLSMADDGDVGNGTRKAGVPAEVDYDVADDDDRWGIE
ncbi:MAG: hypothetical protein M1834_009211 [Cirrosporium novae-zelandiae]|nr:MAG: hypothetical protein M1834_009211 [Cirrosporium novae-zelandiae]